MAALSHNLSRGRLQWKPPPPNFQLPDMRVLVLIVCPLCFCLCVCLSVSFCLFFETGTDVAKASLELSSSCLNLPNARVTGIGRHGQLRLVFNLTPSQVSLGAAWVSSGPGQSLRDEKQEQNTRKTGQGQGTRKTVVAA